HCTAEPSHRGLVADVDRHPIKTNEPLGWPLQPKEKTQEGGLSRARLANEPEAVPGANTDADVVQHLPPVPVPKAHALSGEQLARWRWRHGARFARFRLRTRCRLRARF